MATVSIGSRTSSAALPKSIRRGLARVDARLKGLGLAKGLGTLALVLALGTALGMAADVAFVLPKAVRWAIWGAWVASGMATLGFAVVRPLSRRLRWTDLAAVAEKEHPELGERLTSAVDLLADHADRAHGSRELIAALAEDAADRSRGLNLSQAVSSRPAVLRLALGFLAAMLVLAPSVVRPDPFEPILKRFAAPWLDVDRIGRFVVDVKPGDKVVAIGSDLALAADVHPRFGSGEAPKEAWLEWADEAGATHRTRMAAESDDPAPTRSFSLILPRVPGSLRYRVASGPALSRRHAITAVEPPKVATLSASIEPPSYTKASSGAVKDPSRIDAWQGSRVTLHVSTNKAVKRVAVDWPEEADDDKKADRRTTVPLKSDSEGKEWTATVEAMGSGTYAFAMEDGHGLKNAPEPLRRLVVRIDAAPSAAFLDDKPPSEARPDDVLTAEVEAKDDLAVAATQFHYAIQRSDLKTPPEQGHIDVKLPGLGTRRVRGEAALDLKSLHLQPKDLLTYRFKAIDSKPGPDGPNEGWSEIRTLSIVEKADPLVARKAAAERSEIQQQLDALKRLAAANRQGAEQLRYAADAAQRGNGRWDDARDRALKERETGAREVIDRLEALAKTVEDHPRFSPMARPARQIGRVEAEGGREMLDQARRAADAARRLSDLQQADGRLAAVQARLDELQRLFDALAKQDEDRRKLANLAARQDDLARRAAELADDPANRGGDRARLDQIRNEQEKLGRELNELMRQSPALKADILAVQAREAARLAEEARKLAERQRAEARKTADFNQDDPRLRALAEAQRALEDDARRLAMRVDLPLEQNGRGRLNVDPLRRAEEPIEKGDIAQGRQALEQSEDELRRLSRDLDDVRDDPKALARRLVQRQEALRNQVREAVNQVAPDRNKPLEPRQRQQLVEALKPFADREEAIRRLAAAIPVPDNVKDAAAKAVQATEKADQNLRDPGLKEIEGRQNQAFDALNHLANSLPEMWQRRQLAQQKMAEARNRSEEVARELEQHLRETAPQPGRPHDPDAAAADLVRRVAPLAQKQEQVAEALSRLPIDRRAEPQRERVARRAQKLADALDAIRDQAPRDAKLAADAHPAADWHVIGPFDRGAASPMPVDQPIDLKAIHKGLKDKKLTWRPVRSEGGQGIVDLGKVLGREDNRSAFGFAEMPSPSKGKGQLVVGSDDNLTIWFNGRQVYRFDGSRAHQAAQDKVDVDLIEGANRVLIQCGNGSGDWQFSVALRPPAPTSSEERPDLKLVRNLREQLPAMQVDQRAAFERLDQKMQGREPADDLAADLAGESREQTKSADPPAARAEDERRLATALRNLNVPDAPVLQAEAVRLAERAAKALAEPDPKDAEAPRQAVREAAHAAEVLSRRLTDSLPAREKAAALARAERALDSPEAPRDPASMAKAQRAIARDAAQLPGQLGDQAADRADRAADLAERAARGENGDPNDPPPTPAALAQARVQAAEALEASGHAGEAEKVAGGVEEAPKPEGNEPPDAGACPRPRAGALAARQRDLANEVQAARDRAEKGPDRDAAKAALDRDLARLATQQEALAEAARHLPDTHEATSPARREAERQRRRAEAAQDHAAEGLASRDPAAAVKQAQQAADDLQRLARSLPERPAQAPERPAAAPADPDLPVNERHADEARALARRERQIRERLQAVLGERVAPQERLRDEAAALGRQLAELRDQSREVSPRSQGPAHAAADLLQNQAPQVMTQGAEQLGQGRAPDAREAQRRAAEVVERAAQQTEDLASALRADRPAEAGEPPNAPESPRPDLASARDAQRQAGRQLAQARDPNLGSQSARAASDSMRQAAEGLRAAAHPPQPGQGEALAQAEPGEPTPDSSAVDPHSGPAGRAEADLSELQAMIRSKTGRKWGELPGHLRSEILQMSKGRYRDDYARLIRLYFREIAAEGSERGRRP